MPATMFTFTLSDVAKIAALLVCTLLLFFANGLQATLVPVRAEADGFSTLATGWIGTAFFIGFVTGCLLIPRLLRTIGHVRTYSALAAIAACGVLLHPLKVDVVTWSILRAVMGFSAAGMYAIIEGWLNTQAVNAVRGRVFTTYATLNALALILGNFAFALGDPRTADMFLWVAVLTLVSLLPIALTRQPEPPRPRQTQIRVWRLFGLSPAGFVGAMCSGLAGGAFWALAMSFAQSRGLDQNGVAWFMSAVILGGAMAQWPMGRISDFMDRRVVILLAAGATILASLGLASSHLFGAWSPQILFGAAFLYGASSFPIGSLANAHLNDRSLTGDVSETASGILLISGASAGLGTMLGAWAITVAGPSGLFLYAAAVHAGLMAFVLTRMIQREPAEHDTPASAAPLPGAALAINAKTKDAAKE
jgi:MFS family permease